MYGVFDRLLREEEGEPKEMASCPNCDQHYPVSEDGIVQGFTLPKWRGEEVVAVLVPKRVLAWVEGLLDILSYGAGVPEVAQRGVEASITMAGFYVDHQITSGRK